jgi:prevent-host-death family protein
MASARSLTASEAKAKLGEVLGSLSGDGPVEITRNGRVVAVITAAPPRGGAPVVAGLELLASQYSAGKVTWRQIADETGASFGELLVELSKQNLPLPLVTAEKRPEQLAHLEAIFKRAAQR